MTEHEQQQILKAIASNTRAIDGLRQLYDTMTNALLDANKRITELERNR
jgi:hypothetical protein